MYIRNGAVGNQFCIRGFLKLPLGGRGGSKQLYFLEQTVKQTLGWLWNGETVQPHSNMWDVYKSNVT